MSTKTNGADLLILAGGMATRLDGVNGALPKALLPVSGRPFIHWQADEAIRSYPGIGRMIISARQAEASLFAPMIVWPEESPMGTGGAILDAARRGDLSDPFLVLNGDVLFRFDPQAILAQAILHGAALQAIHVPDTAAFGTLKVENGLVTAFHEKTGIQAPGLINAGLYGFTHQALTSFGQGACSFERDLAPELARTGQLACVETAGPFMDIGTPETYAASGAFITGNGFNNF